MQKILILFFVFPVLAQLFVLGLVMLTTPLVHLLPESQAESAQPYLMAVIYIIAILCSMAACRTIWPKGETGSQPAADPAPSGSA